MSFFHRAQLELDFTPGVVNISVLEISLWQTLDCGHYQYQRQNKRYSVVTEFRNYGNLYWSQYYLCTCEVAHQATCSWYKDTSQPF